jgi:hypothetical protein
VLEIIRTIRTFHGVATNRETYQERAVACSVAADKSSNPGDRLKLFYIAQLFLRLADHASAMEQGSGYGLLEQPKHTAKRGV